MFLWNYFENWFLKTFYKFSKVDIFYYTFFFHCPLLGHIFTKLMILHSVKWNQYWKVTQFAKLLKQKNKELSEKLTTGFQLLIIKLLANELLIFWWLCLQLYIFLLPLFQLWTHQLTFLQLLVPQTGVSATTFGWPAHSTFNLWYVNHKRYEQRSPKFYCNIIENCNIRWKLR